MMFTKEEIRKLYLGYPPEEVDPQLDNATVIVELAEMLTRLLNIIDEYIRRD